jgi:DNA polymerase III sliding clamp (beta) subunit (PCNA family)
MIKLDKAEFLNKLESVLPGISTREIIEQSSCVIFQDGFMMTYNDEIACTQESGLDIVGAVAAMPLVNILRKLTEDTIEIEAKEKHLLIKCARKRAKIVMDSEVLLPTDGIEKPKKWKALPDDFADAVAVVQACAGTDESRFDLTCVHIHPEHMEACDGSQAGRYKLTMPLKKPILIRRSSLKYIESLDMTEFSRTANWIHFRNSDGLVLSCRKWIYTKENFPNLSEYMKAKGKKTILPKGMVEAIDKAQIFSSDNAESDEIEVQLSKGKIKITGKGATGRYTEHGKIKYKGKDMRFTINPTLFSDLVSRHNKCLVSEKLLKVKTGNYTYITALKEVK